MCLLRCIPELTQWFHMYTDPYSTSNEPLPQGRTSDVDPHISLQYTTWWGLQGTLSSPSLSAHFSAEAQEINAHFHLRIFSLTKYQIVFLGHVSPPKALWGHLPISQTLKGLMVWLNFSIALKNYQGPCPHCQSHWASPTWAHKSDLTSCTWSQTN